MSLFALAGALIFASLALFFLGGTGAQWLADWVMTESEKSSTDD
jgi:hypothetical protein